MKTTIHLKLERQTPFADSHEFGVTGPYERILGKIEFSIDPNDPANQNVVDLDKAPRNKYGLVEFSSDLDILKPVDMARGNQRVLYDVNNRGNKTILTHMNDAEPGPDPMTLAHAGNGFLMRRGYTIVWSGWQGDLLSINGLLTAELPEATENGKRLQGTIRQEFIVEKPGVLSMPLSGDPSIRNYEAVNLNTSQAFFTRRRRETDPREPIGPEEWAFAEANIDEPSGSTTIKASASNCYLKSGFKPGWIYELIYETEGSRVMGLGLVGIRDLVSFLRYETHDSNGYPNPLSGHVEKVYIFGLSLSARVIRQFIYDGYNCDLGGRRVFDVAYPHVSGAGRLFTNARFAQVGRYPRQHEEHQWPSERYPFAYSVTDDLFTEELDCVLKRPDSDPLVMHTHTATEYWQRHASLGHTNPRTDIDLEIPDTVRIYVISSAQHGGATPPTDDVSQEIPNTMSNGPFLRAALVLMDNWASDGKPPPLSLVPRRTDDTLVLPEEVFRQFPAIPGVDIPISPSRLPKYNYGPDFENGMITEHPPKPLPGQEYPVHVPQVDLDGNDIAGLRSPEVEAPIGTHTGWSLRKKGFAEGELFSLTGSFVPFARTKIERANIGDPRLSIEERYVNHDSYVRDLANAARSLMGKGFLLEEDVARYVRAAMNRDPFDENVPLGPLQLDWS